MSTEFVDASGKADVTPSILKQLVEDAEDLEKEIEVRMLRARVRSR